MVNADAGGRLAGGANAPYFRPMEQKKSSALEARFGLGQIVKHRVYPFRGVVFDVDPEFDNTEEWYQSIPEDVRPRRDQPFYHLFAENDESEYVAYVSEQNLLPDEENGPVRHPQVNEVFSKFDGQRYVTYEGMSH